MTTITFDSADAAETALIIAGSEATDGDVITLEPVDALYALEFFTASTSLTRRRQLFALNGRLHLPHPLSGTSWRRNPPVYKSRSASQGVQ